MECSKGTYIRSLCRDIGEALGCGGCMESLERIRACGIEAKDCITLAGISEAVKRGDIGKHILPTDFFYKDCTAMTVSGDEEKRVRNGNIFSVSGKEAGRYRVYLEDGTFAALYDIKGREAKLCRMFL